MSIAVMSCILTVAILGSGIFLYVRWQRSRDEQARITTFVNGLQNLSPEQLRTSADELSKRPRMARRVLPRVMGRARGRATPAERLAAVRFLARFAGDRPDVADALYGLRRNADEGVAAEAAAALAAITPRDAAAARLASCLDAPAQPAVVDVVIDELLKLDSTGRAALEARMPLLSPDRRMWVVGLVMDRRPADHRQWLELFAADPDADVRKRVLDELLAADVQAQRRAGEAELP